MVMSHILFVDDMLIFYESNLDQLLPLRCLFLSFEVVLGRKVVVRSPLLSKFLSVLLGSPFKVKLFFNGIKKQWSVSRQLEADVVVQLLLDSC